MKKRTLNLEKGDTPVRASEALVIEPAKSWERLQQAKRTGARAGAGHDSCCRFEEFTPGSEGSICTHKNISKRLTQSFTKTASAHELQAT